MLNWKKAQVAAGGLVTWTEAPVLTTALWWKQRVRLGREDGSALGPELYYEIRYETLVPQPATECAVLGPPEPTLSLNKQALSVLQTLGLGD
jgi:hypothetical protein